MEGIFAHTVLIAVYLYFMKDVHGDFKELKRTVARLEEKVIQFSYELKARRDDEKKEEKE